MKVLGSTFFFVFVFKIHFWEIISTERNVHNCSWMLHLIMTLYNYTTFSKFLWGNEAYGVCKLLKIILREITQFRWKGIGIILALDKLCLHAIIPNQILSNYLNGYDTCGVEVLPLSLFKGSNSQSNRRQGNAVFNGYRSLPNRVKLSQWIRKRSTQGFLYVIHHPYLI